MQLSDTREQITVIQPTSGWRLIDFKELIAYRDLFYFLAWRNIKVIYAQSILGFSWAILQPVIQVALFTIIFGKVAKIPTDGIPYVLFSTIAIIPWTYMQSAMTEASQSLVGNQSMLGKVYFPRLIFPTIPVLTKLVDFSISLIIILAVIIYYKVGLTWNIVYIPIFLILMMIFPLGVGLWLSALAIRYRDVKFAMGFVMRMLMYTAPIVYSASSISEGYRMIYSLNPIVGVIEGFRACFLGTPMMWQFILPGMVVSLVILLTGALYFRRMERVFVDVI